MRKGIADLHRPPHISQAANGRYLGAIASVEDTTSPDELTARPCQPAKRNGRGYDLAVVGAGSAGFSAAITAAERGAQVALIGGGTIGGTCVNIGCVPSKTLVRAMEAVHQAAAAKRFAGMSAAARVDDWDAVMRQKDDLVSSLRQAKYADLLPAYNRISYRQGKARGGTV